ncbi:TldD/PmbA family protein [Candidatus Woesearchaeota archaeon]|nr:TldD/PmbA family protein [Candidatus Woesearchaeota archaeon]
MEDFIDKALEMGAEYCEINHSEVERTGIELSNKKVVDISDNKGLLYSARVLFNKGWGNAFSFSDDIDALIKEAIDNALPGNVKIEETKEVKRSFKFDVKKNPLDYGIEEKKDLIKGYFDDHKNSKIKNTSIHYSDAVKKHEFWNSFGSNLKLNDTVCSATVISYAQSNERMESYFDNLSEHGGLEILKGFESKVKACNKAVAEILNAKNAKGGKFNIVVDQGLAGVFAHEAVGHACEADIILSDNSVLKGMEGTKVGVDGLTIGDNGKLNNWGYCPYDSEGVIAQDTTLIEDGILKGFLHSRETAKVMGEEPTGNGRAQSLENRPIPRMTNTYIKPKDWHFDEMLEDVKNGYYLKDSYGGQVDTATGEFLFNAKEGFVIKNGIIAERVRGASMLGSILKTLNSIRAIGNDIQYHGGGACGKSGQYALTGEGSPHLLLDNITVGGAE